MSSIIADKTLDLHDKMWYFHNCPEWRNMLWPVK